MQSDPVPLQFSAGHMRLLLQEKSPCPPAYSAHAKADVTNRARRRGWKPAWNPANVGHGASLLCVKGQREEALGREVKTVVSALAP